MLRRHITTLAMGLCVLGGMLTTATPAHALEAQAATINVWYDLGAWPCSTTCVGGYQTGYDWIKVKTVGVSGGPDFDWESFNDATSYYSVTTTNCAIDSVYAHLEAPPGTGNNTGAIDISFTRYGAPGGGVLVGGVWFTSDTGVGSGGYTLTVPVTGSVDGGTVNACLAGPRAIASWSGTGTLVRAVV